MNRVDIAKVLLRYGATADAQSKVCVAPDDMICLLVGDVVACMSHDARRLTTSDDRRSFWDVRKLSIVHRTLSHHMYSGGATPGRARSNDLAGRFTAMAAPCLLLCFASIILWTENKKFTISDCWPLYFDSETISVALAAFVFWGRRLKTVVNFFEEKVHLGDLARWCFDLEMTWLLCCAGAATAHV